MGACGYLVPWVSAKKQASQRGQRTGRQQIKEGDGCTGRCKKAGSRRARYAVCQYIWAHELLARWATRARGRSRMRLQKQL